MKRNLPCRLMILAVLLIGTVFGMVNAMAATDTVPVRHGWGMVLPQASIKEPVQKEFVLPRKNNDPAKSLPPSDVLERIRKETGNLSIYGNVVFSLPIGNGRHGIWRFNTSGQFDSIYPHELVNGGTYVYSDGLYYVYYYYYHPYDYFRQHPLFTRIVYDTETWKQVPMRGDNLTWDTHPWMLCTNGKSMYGWYGKESPYKFGKLDLLTNTWTYISESPTVWGECAFGKDGFIYCIASDESVYKLNPNNGNAVKIGDTGCAAFSNASGLVGDVKSGRFFRTCVDDAYQASLYEVNSHTGNATKLCDFANSEQILGLYIPGQEDDKVPAPVSEVSVEFPKGSLNGTVDFKCPVTLNDNTAASGKLNYTVSLNEVPVKTGETAYGSTMSIPLSVDSAAIYCFAVSVSNEKGKSLSKRKILFIGNDTPQIPEVNINYSDGNFNVHWNTPKGIHEGYLDTLLMRYTVKRYPDDVVVAKEISANSFVDAVPMPSTYVRYYYTVTANYKGFETQPGKSNIIPLGVCKVPYLETFDNERVLDNFVIVEGNQYANNTWHFGQNFNAKNDTCICIKENYAETSDDWLISPPILLEKGKTYNISADFTSMNNRLPAPARYVAFMGRTAKPDSMTMHLTGFMDVADMPYLQPDKHTWSFTAPESGEYHIGIHAVTPVRGAGMDLDNLAVSLPLAGVPDSITNLKVMLEDNPMEYKAIITGQLPVKDIDGNPLTSAKNITVLRNGRQVKVLTDILPGEEFMYEDRDIKPGTDCRWDVVCSNSKGEGRWSELTLRLSDPNYKAEAVSNLKVTEITETKLKITWTPPEVDRGGRLLDKNKLRYIVGYAYNGYVKTTEKYTNYGDTCLILDTESKQQAMDIYVIAENVYGRSEKVNIHRIAGESYKLPFRESFANGSSGNYISGTWVARDNEFGLESVDDDNGIICAEFLEQYTTEGFYTGKIDLGNAVNPYFSFYLYNIRSIGNDSVINDLNEVEIFAREEGTEEWVPLLRGTVYDLCGAANAKPNEWNYVRVGLDKFKGKRIRLQVTGTCVSYIKTAIDRLMVSDAVERNVGVNVFRVPPIVRFNKDFSLTVRVENRGEKQISDYDLAFYRDEEEEPFRIVPGVSLAPEGVAYISAHDTLGINQVSMPHKYKAVVRCENDADLRDNETNEVWTACEYGPKAHSSALVGNSVDNVVSLVWKAPVVTAGYSGSDGMESFENYNMWAYENVGDWTFLDMDKQGIGTFLIPTNLGHISLKFEGSPLLSKRSFIVLNTDEFGSGIKKYLPLIPHSGEQFIASLAPHNGSQADDWLVSPLLDGKSQTVKFFARSCMANHPERIEMLYSLCGKDTADFISVKEVASVPGEWTEYSFEIPAGAKYFAVRSKAVRGSMLMLDDFTFNVAPMLVDGYKVYRDGKRVNDDLVSDVLYTDYGCPGGKHPYHVTAIYNDGDESAPSNAFYINNSVQVIPDGVTVEGGKGYIAVAGAEGKSVTVVNIAGMVCYDAVPENEVKIMLPEGVYLVRISGVSVKVIVR